MAKYILSRRRKDVRDNDKGDEEALDKDSIKIRRSNDLHSIFFFNIRKMEAS